MVSTMKQRLFLAITLFSIALSLSFFVVTAHATSVTLAWDASISEGVTGYKLYYGTSSGVYSQQVDVGNVLQTTVSDLPDNTAYYFAVTAYNPAYESGYSNEVRWINAIPIYTKPEAPNNLRRLFQGAWRWFFDRRNGG